MRSSPPVTIQVLTIALAKQRPPDILADARTNAEFRRFANEYKSLRPALTIGHIPEMYNNWTDQREALEKSLNALPSSGNPRSPYVQVNANLENAVEALGSAEERAFACDSTSEQSNLAVSDYFFAAVRKELSTGKAYVVDAFDPPPYASPSGSCKSGISPTDRCPKPSADVQYLGGPSPSLPRGLSFKGTVIAFLEIGPDGKIVIARTQKTSGNAEIDRSVLEAAKRGEYAPQVMSCAATYGDYFFYAHFPPKPGSK